jgi:hypothetical protein
MTLDLTLALGIGASGCFYPPLLSPKTKGSAAAGVFSIGSCVRLPQRKRRFRFGRGAGDIASGCRVKKRERSRKRRLVLGSEPRPRDSASDRREREAGSRSLNSGRRPSANHMLILLRQKNLMERAIADEPQGRLSRLSGGRFGPPRGAGEQRGDRECKDRRDGSPVIAPIGQVCSATSVPGSSI